MTDIGKNTNRWAIAVAGFFLQMALGSVYAWSLFRVPLARQFHWSIEEVTLTFTISIFVLGVAAFFGGLWLNKKGPGRQSGLDRVLAQLVHLITLFVSNYVDSRLSTSFAARNALFDAGTPQ